MASSSAVMAPFFMFPDLEGEPLEQGFLYIGTANLNPIPTTNRKATFWDKDLTIPAAQPIRTLGGFPARNGSPARIYVDGDYSILAQDKNGATLYSALTAAGAIGSALISNISAEKVIFTYGATGSVETTLQAMMRNNAVHVFGFLSDTQKADVIAGTLLVDCAAAIQAAIDYIESKGGGVLYLPTAKYRIDDNLEVPNKVSIYGDGGSATEIHAFNCNGLVFDSASYDGGNMFYEDFAIKGMTGTTGNWAAVESLIPSGGTPGVDSRDGLNFNRVTITDFNQAFIIGSTWEWSVIRCKIYRVNNPFELRDYCVAGRIMLNNATYEGGFATGTADQYGVDFSGSVVEGMQILGNQLFAFDRGVNVDNAAYVVIDDNDIFATEIGIAVSTANNGCFITKNYVEIGGNNAIGLRFAPLNSETTDIHSVSGNTFICSSGTGTVGIKIGESGSTFAWNQMIHDNIFIGMAANDILGYAVGNLSIKNNRCNSSGPTNSIEINDTVLRASYIEHNRCAKAILADATSVANGVIIIGNNIVSGSQNFGTIWANGGKLQGMTIGDVTPGAGIFTTLGATTRVYTHYDEQTIANAANADIPYVMSTPGMWLVSIYGEQSANVSQGPGLYLVRRQGTQTVVTTVTAFASVTVTVTGAFRINIANATGASLIFRSNLLKVV